MIKSIPFNLYESSFKTGSSVICNPPVLDTDIDYMIYSDVMDKLVAHLVDTGWAKCDPEDYEENTRPFLAFRKDKYNFIVTNNLDYYDKFEEATRLATKLNLLKKEDRITLFSYVIEGNIDA